MYKWLKSYVKMVRTYVQMVENLRERDYAGTNKWLRGYVGRNGWIRRKKWVDT